MFTRMLKSTACLARAGAVAAVMMGAGVAYAAGPMADEAVVEQMTQAELSDIVVTRADSKINVAGTLNGQGIVLVYDEATGALETVDGNSPDVDAHVAFLNLGASKDAQTAE
ncbi:hypothetical protein PE067_04110 [Paracoccus sp. DMF-8]|uniref:hypothetical protein n=1 Tax=Paracoccus sp. DMF-8 TaxID=3019445 RepID=UPI0023E84791|nr:hypothetical protein [Paracoccus sp. DMF-8]MDF3605410.1 hypothetical protein [Paracoccus sp. DMF-8]